jgi:hypothetical protein
VFSPTIRKTLPNRGTASWVEGLAAGCFEPGDAEAGEGDAGDAPALECCAAAGRKPAKALNEIAAMVDIRKLRRPFLVVLIARMGNLLNRVDSQGDGLLTEHATKIIITAPL